MTISLSKPKVSELLGQMTLPEKLAQLSSYWIYDLQLRGEFERNLIEEKLRNGVGQITRLAGASTLEPAAAAKAANALQRHLLENTRLGIPAIVHEECCSGAMMLEGTRFPQMIGLASTFQPEMAERMTAVIRGQLRAVGAHQGLAPVLDVSRDPRWGRIEETFGEDPTLVAHFGVAYVRGLQGDDLAEGVIATGKHFVGHSLSLGGLNCGPAQIGDRELWNNFIGPFQAAIRDAGLASIMCAYPELDGELVAASERILTQWLREELRFEGLLVSDYNAIDMIHNYHNVAPDLAAAAQMALRAGIEVELPTKFCYGDPLAQALEAGDIDLEFVDKAVARHLKAKAELGLFDNPYVDEGRAVEIFQDRGAVQLAAELAAKSLVLLKNDGVLPLARSIGKLAVIGPNADNGRGQMGDYSYASVMDTVQATPPENSSFAEADLPALAARAAEAVTVLAGITAASGEQTEVLYARGCDILGANRQAFPEALQAAEAADAVVLVLGDRSGLVQTCSTGETRDSADLELPGVQRELAQAVMALGKPTIVVLINGRPYAAPWLHDGANAILEAWLPGEQGGTAVAAALFGDANPGGKLPVSVPRHVGQLPVFYNHKPSGMYSNWHQDYVAESVAPLYAFGHGLSYTQFEFANLNIEDKPLRAGDQVDIAMQVTNTGRVTGDEVVQLYLCDIYASSPRPVQELKGYARISLQPGETRTLTFHLPVNQLAFYNNDLKLVLEAGKFEVMLGSSSQDIRLRGEIEVVADAQLPHAARVFVCPVDIH